MIAVRMPYKTSSPASLEDAQLAIDDTGVESLTIDITPQIDAYFERVRMRRLCGAAIRWPGNACPFYMTYPLNTKHW